LRNKFNLQSLNSKLIINFVLFAVFIFAIIWFMQAVMLNTTYEIIRKNGIEKLSKEIENKYGDQDFEKELNSMAYNNSSRIIIMDTNLDTIMSTDDILGHIPMSVSMDISNLLNDFKDTDIINKDIQANNFNTKINLYATKMNNNNYIVILSTIDPVNSTVKVLTVQLIYITIFSLILAVIVAIFISKKLSYPIFKINEKAKELEKGNFNVEFKQGFYTEVDELSNTLNNTAKKLRNN